MDRILIDFTIFKNTQQYRNLFAFVLGTCNIYAAVEMAVVYLVILDAMLMSTYLSPMLTSMPPRMAGSTLVVSFRVSPFLMKAFSVVCTSFREAASRGFAVVTSHATSPRSAAMMVAKLSTTAPIFWRRPFSAMALKKLTVRGLALVFSSPKLMASFLSAFVWRGLRRISRRGLSFFTRASKSLRSFSTLGSAFCLEAAEYRALA